MSQRSIQLEGCLNFRDLGGYPTRDGRSLRWGQLFRSDALHLLTPTDVARLRELRIGTIVDLRSSAEVGAEGRGPLSGESIDFHHIPLFDGEQQRRPQRPPDQSLADIYFLLAQFARQPIARVISVLAESESPAVYHCAAGKDRTGVISAVLLGLLGVEDELIVADYALSGANIDAIIERLNATEGYRTMLAQLPPESMHALPQTMEGFLEKIRETYGSMEGYARDIGVEAPSVDRLRAMLLA